MSGADLSDALSDMWRSVLLFVPTALAFLAILLIGYLLARLVRTVVAKTLRRVGFDRAVEHGAIGRALGGRAEPSDLCAKIAFYAVLLFALQLAFGIWGPNAVSDLLTALIGWLPRAFVAIVIIVVAAAIGGAARDLIGSALGGLAYGRVLARVAYWLIVALGVIAALDQVRIATAVTQPVLIAVLATVAGVLIVGVGGGLIRPMQQRWEVWLERAGTESAAIREHARSYADERARVAAEKQAAEEEAARVAAERAAEQERLAEQARIDEAEKRARAAAGAEAARIEAERAAAEAEREQALAAAEAEQQRAVAAAEAERQRALAAAEGEKTQVIPMQRPWPGSDDRPHVVPGFDDPAPDDTAETTTWLHRDAGGGIRPAGDPAWGDGSGDDGGFGVRAADELGDGPNGDRTADDRSGADRTPGSRPGKSSSSAAGERGGSPAGGPGEGAISASAMNQAETSAASPPETSAASPSGTSTGSAPDTTAASQPETTAENQAGTATADKREESTADRPESAAGNPPEEATASQAKTSAASRPATDGPGVADEPEPTAPAKAGTRDERDESPRSANAEEREGPDDETTADVTARPGSGSAPDNRDPDSTMVISPSERRQVLPQQATPADGEKTQVIRVRRDDESPS